MTPRAPRHDGLTHSCSDSHSIRDAPSVKFDLGFEHRVLAVVVPTDTSVRGRFVSAYLGPELVRRVAVAAAAAAATATDAAVVCPRARALGLVAGQQWVRLARRAREHAERLQSRVRARARWTARRVRSGGVTSRGGARRARSDSSGETHVVHSIDRAAANPRVCDGAVYSAEWREETSFRGVKGGASLLTRHAFTHDATTRRAARLDRVAAAEPRVAAARLGVRLLDKRGPQPAARERGTGECGPGGETAHSFTGGPV